VAKRIHIHVYEVVQKAEVDFEPKDGTTIQQCQADALEMARNDKLQFQEPDCRFIAVGFDNG